MNECYVFQALVLVSHILTHVFLTVSMTAKADLQNNNLSTLEENPCVRRIEFLPPEINVRYQLDCVCHKVLTYVFSPFCAMI